MTWTLRGSRVPAERSYEGRIWWSFSDADVMFHDGFPGTPSAFPTVMTHEVGHGIGWRQSNQNHLTDGACNSLVEECSSSAIMNSSAIAALGYTLQTWDRNASQAVYPGGTCGPTCTLPVITSQPQSHTIGAGQRQSMSRRALRRPLGNLSLSRLLPRKASHCTSHCLR